MLNNESTEIYKLFNELIELAINDIYHNQIEKGLNLVIKIMEFYEEIKPSLEPHLTIKIEDVLNMILIAAEKKDYILVTDLLEYELRQLLAMQLEER